MRKIYETEEKKKKKSRRKLIKVILAILGLLFLVLLLIVGLRSCNQDKPNIPEPKPNVVDRDIADNIQKVKSPEYEKYEKELNNLSQQASILYTPSPILGGAKATGLLIWYPNVGDADYIMIDIYTKDSDELIYSSPLIPRDSAITVDKLDVNLPIGTYKCKVITTAVEEENGKRIAKPNKPVTNIDITIAE